MIGRGDHHGVDIFAVEHTAKIVIRFYFAANSLLRALQIGLVDVAQRDNLGIGMIEESTSSCLPRLPTPINASRF